jgi:hypothetical protein
MLENGMQLLGSLQGAPPDTPSGSSPMSWDIEDIDDDQGLMILRGVAGHNNYALADVSSPAAPRYLGAWSNDLYSNHGLGGYWNGAMAALLPGGYQLRAGETGVAYGGGEVRSWGGFELYKNPPPGDPPGFEFIAAAADEGYQSLEAFDLVPVGMLCWPDEDGTQVLASYRDPWEDSLDSGRLVLYRTAADLPTARVDALPPPPVARRPGRLRLGRPYPNPATNGLHFSVALTRSSKLSVRVIDPAGRTVATPVRGEFAGGNYRFDWSLRGAAGRRVAPGIYFVIAEIDGRAAGSRQVAVLR